MAGLRDARPAGQQASKKAGRTCSQPLSFQKTIAADQKLLQRAASKLACNPDGKQAGCV
jgi:hypothetical protein